MNTLNSIFKIVIVHEDVFTGIQAADTLKRLAARLETELGIDSNPWRIDSNIWKFELLQDSEMRERAVAESIEADMIIISADGKTELPACVRSWIESVLPRKQGATAALVALFDRGGESRSATPRPGDYLRQMAEQCGMDFFCNTDTRPGHADSGIESILSGFEDDSGISEEVMPHDSDRRGWGINE